MDRNSLLQIMTNLPDSTLIEAFRAIGMGVSIDDKQMADPHETLESFHHKTVKFAQAPEPKMPFHVPKDFIEVTQQPHPGQFLNDFTTGGEDGTSIIDAFQHSQAMGG